ncbi:hypothetical protein Tco_0511905 [Tanacetum coccineum]
MDSDKYLEGQSMQRPPLFESDSFIYWKNRFETYVKSKDLDLWHVITNGDFQPIIQNPETKLDEVVPFEKQTDDLKRRLAKNNEAKMVIYNALPRKEYERIFMCNTAKEIWKTLLITHQGNSQVKDNKIDLLVQQYEQFFISEDESIDSAFARFNTIITSLKALDEGPHGELDGVVSPPDELDTPKLVKLVKMGPSGELDGTPTLPDGRDTTKTVETNLAIENRFGGNTATKKTQKNLLKQQYENFAASSTEVIEQTYERLQKLISQLEMHEIETLSLDDLFNNLKAYESEVKGTSSSTTNSHNVAFLSSSSTNSATRAVNTAQGINTASTQDKVLEEYRKEADMATRKIIGFCSPRWSVSTATREDTLQGSTEHPGIKKAGTGSLPEGLCQLRKILQMPYSSSSTNSEGNPQQYLKDKGVTDSGCSRHMIGNRSNLTYYEEIDEGFVAFGGYSTNNKAFRVFNCRTRIVEENLHLQYVRINLILQKWDNGTKPCDNIGSLDAGFKPSGEEEKKDAKDLGNEDSKDPSTEESRVNQEKDASVNSTNTINTVSPTVNTAGIEDNVVDENIVYGCVDDLNMLELKDIVYSDNDEDVGAEADMNNLDTFMLVSPILTIRIHKDHPIKQIIGDLNSSPQTRRMTKNVTE